MVVIMVRIMVTVVVMVADCHGACLAGTRAKLALGLTVSRVLRILLLLGTAMLLVVRGWFVQQQLAYIRTAFVHFVDVLCGRHNRQ